MFLGATIAVVFDRDVKIINISKLFEVREREREREGGSERKGWRVHVEG